MAMPAKKRKFGPNSGTGVSPVRFRPPWWDVFSPSQCWSSFFDLPFAGTVFVRSQDQGDDCFAESESRGWPSAQPRFVKST
jgi:hypothetical protein